MGKRIDKKNEFRKLNNKEGKSHSKYVYVKVGNKYIYLGITHAEITDGIRNIPLEENPEPNKKEKAYITLKPKEENRSSFGKVLKNWKFSDQDKKKVQKIIEDNKPKKKP